MIVLDTNVLIEIMDRRSEKGEEAVKLILESGEPFCTTAINLHEILYGLYKYAKPVEDVLLLPVLSFTKEDAKLAAELELEMERRGMPVRRLDAMIAAITINNGAKLFTYDLRHFKPMEELGLKLFPWWNIR